MALSLELRTAALSEAGAAHSDVVPVPALVRSLKRFSVESKSCARVSRLTISKVTFTLEPN